MNTVPLFVVDQAFHLSGRGCVLAPGPSIEDGAPVVRVGDRIRLVLPSGEVLNTRIKGLEMLKRLVRPRVLTAAILLPTNITKEQVPIGTHVYLAASEP